MDGDGGRQRWTEAVAAGVGGGVGQRQRLQRLLSGEEDNGWREQGVDGGGVCDNGDGCRRRL